MVEYKGKVSKKDKQKIELAIGDLIDLYGDFFLTKNNIRLFIKENFHLLYECLKNGDKVAYEEEGIALVTGWSDNAKRKYVKLLTKNNDSAIRLLQVIIWNEKTELFAKIKKDNPIKDAFLKTGFNFYKNRGKEILLVKPEFNKE